MPDIEYATTLWLRARHPGVRVVNELPSTLETAVPLLFVAVVPGGGDDGVSGEAMLDVQSFAATRTLMWQLADSVHESMLAMRGQYAGGLAVDDVVTNLLPGFVTYNNPAVRRAVASYRLTRRAPVRA
ncbi:MULTISPECIES: phage tail termination protein [Streptomyces]